jgi:ParB family chromosome partitioning protein
LRPVAIGDVEVLLSDRVPQWQQLVYIEETDEGFIVKRRRYLSHEEFYDVHQAIKEMGGRYRAEERNWIIPRAERAETAVEELEPEMRFVPISRLRFPYESLRLEPSEELEELVESIKSVGVLQPILVRPKGELLEVVAGERRAKAAEKAGLVRVPVIIKKLSDEEADLARLIENVQRRDLSDYEKARWLRRLQEKYGYSTTKLAEIVGKSQPWVALHLNILRAEEVITRVITSNPVLQGSVKPREVMDKLTEFQARAILSAPEKYQPILAEQVVHHVSQGLEPPSARELERIWKITEEAEAEVKAEVEAEVEAKVEEAMKELPELEEFPKEPEMPVTPRPEAAAQPPEPRRTRIEKTEIDQAIFTCKTCGASFLIVHIDPTGEHRLKPVTIVEPEEE